MFKAFPEIKKELWGGGFWSNGGYIGTVGEGITAEIIRDRSKVPRKKKKDIDN